jgi:hypothetical protein
MKGVPNLISYLHNFFWNFSQLLDIYFELFSSGSKFYFGKTLTCGAQRSEAVSPRAVPWLVAVGGAVRTRACGIKSSPDRAAFQPPSAARQPLAPPRLTRRRPDRTAVPTAPSPCPCRAVRCLGRLTAIPTVSARSRRRLRIGTPRRRVVLRRPRVSPRAIAHHPGPTPHPERSCHHVRCPTAEFAAFSPRRRPSSPSLSFQPRCQRAPSPPKPLSVPECSAAMGAVHLCWPRRRDEPSPWVLGPVLGPNVGQSTSRHYPPWSWAAPRVAVGRAHAS